MKETIQTFLSELRVVDTIWIFGGIAYVAKKFWAAFKKAHGYMSEKEDIDQQIKSDHELLLELAESIKKLNDRIDAGNEAHREVLKDRLEQMHAFFTKRGYITPSELDKASSMYESYHRLGGNGVGTRMYEDMMALPIKDI